MEIKYKILIWLKNNLNIHHLSLYIKKIYKNKYNCKFYLPNYKKDLIQRSIIKNGFFEIAELKILDNYISQNAVIIDAGSNIGNHAIYWANNGAKRVYCFEPIKSTFKILFKNTKLNHFEKTIKLFNIGLSDEKSTAEISHYNPDNIGGTNIKKCLSGEINIDLLDNIKIEENKVDFLKIDVEGGEIELLKGALETINKYRPLIFIETFEKNFKEVNNFLISQNYRIIRTFPYNNYLFKPNEREFTSNVQ